MFPYKLLLFSCVATVLWLSMTALFLQQLFVLELLLLLIIWCFIGHFSTSAAPVGAFNSTGLIISTYVHAATLDPTNPPQSCNLIKRF